MRNPGGFTLLEVLISLAILAGGIMLLANSWSGNLMRVRKSNLYHSVGALLERKMIEVEAEFKDKPLNEVPANEEGDFGNDFPQYRWKLESRDLKFPDLAPLIIGREGGADETLLSMIRQMTDLISKAIKEVKVTIIVKTPKKEMEYSATTYLIDYNVGIGGVPGGGAPAGGGR